jgi:hypothetical protein
MANWWFGLSTDPSRKKKLDERYLQERLGIGYTSSNRVGDANTPGACNNQPAD